MNGYKSTHWHTALFILRGQRHKTQLMPLTLDSVVISHREYSRWMGSSIVRWHHTRLYSVTNRAPFLGMYRTGECTKLLLYTCGRRITGRVRSPMPSTQHHNIRTEVTVDQSVEKPTAIQKVSCYKCTGSQSVFHEFLRRRSLDTCF